MRRIVAFAGNGWNYALRCARRRRIHSPARLGRKRRQATGPLKQRSLKADSDHVDRRGGVRGDVRERQWNEADFQRRITFELRRTQRWDARARTGRMYRVPQAGPWWPAVGARLERGVRHHSEPSCQRIALCAPSCCTAPAAASSSVLKASLPALNTPRSVVEPY